ncbi:MAG TPA: hypothetical protein VM575_05245 [Nocardioides sp.]|nr:hypothetical protein [Nocardioides sp.]
MPEQLSTLMHRSVDDVEVPPADALHIAGRGRALRTRRRVATVVAGAAAVAVLGAGGVVVGDALDGSPRGADVAQHDRGDASAADGSYDEWGAHAGGDQVTIGGTTVTLAAAPWFLAQTSAGVVAQLTGADDGTDFVLVRPDGTTAPLTIPAGTTTIDGDPTAPTVAWIELGTDEGTVHVWDVNADREVAAVRLDLPGATPTLGRQYLQPVQLDGPTVYVGTGTGSALRVTWATGAVVEVPRAPVAVRAGTGVAYDGDRWYVTDAATGAVRWSLGRDVQTASLSPDGKWVFYVDTRDGLGYVVPATGGRRVEVAGLTATSTWTREGQLIGPGTGEYTVRRCSTDGRCEERPAEGLGPEAPSPLIPDFHMVG